MELNGFRVPPPPPLHTPFIPLKKSFDSRNQNREKQRMKLQRNYGAANSSQYYSKQIDNVFDNVSLS